MIYIYCALIVDGIIETIVCSESTELCHQLLGGNWVPVYNDSECGIGWTWDGEKFNPPEPEIGGEE